MFRAGQLSAADAADLNRLLARVLSLEGTTYTAPLTSTGSPGGVRTVTLAVDLQDIVGGVLSATANADNTGTSWTQGTLTGPAGGEVVDLQPRYGAGVVAGGLTFAAHQLYTGLEYLCRDTGNVSPGTGRRRLYAWPIGLVACDSSVTPNVLRSL